MGGGHRGPRRALPAALATATAAAVAAAAAAAAAAGVAALADAGCAAAIAPEQPPPLSAADLAAAAAAGTAAGAPAATCGGHLPGTRHTVVCVGGYPVGGYVLEPPRPARRALLFLHGLSAAPAAVHLAVLGTLLGGADGAAANDWATVRVLLPLAPRLPRLYTPPDAAWGLPTGPVHAWFDISHTLPFQPVGALGGGDSPAGVAAALAATRVVGDRLGLAASACRVAAVVTAQAAGALVDGRRRLRPVPAHRTAVVGHSLGAAFVWHLAVAARAVPWPAAVALSGYLPLTAYYERFPEAVPPAGPPRRRGQPPLTLVSVAADGDTVVAPALSAAAAHTGGVLAGRTGVRVVHKVLRGSDHASYLVGDENTDAVRRLMLDALRVGGEGEEGEVLAEGGTSPPSSRVVDDLFGKTAGGAGRVCQ